MSSVGLMSSIRIELTSQQRQLTTRINRVEYAAARVDHHGQLVGDVVRRVPVVTHDNGVRQPASPKQMEDLREWVAVSRTPGVTPHSMSHGKSPSHQRISAANAAFSSGSVAFYALRATRADGDVDHAAEVATSSCE